MGSGASQPRIDVRIGAVRLEASGRHDPERLGAEIAEGIALALGRGTPPFPRDESATGHRIGDAIAGQLGSTEPPFKNALPSSRRGR